MPFAKLTQGLSALGNNLDNQLSKSCEQMVGRESGSHSNHPTGILKSFSTCFLKIFFKCIELYNLVMQRVLNNDILYI